jgi:septum formation protein
MTLPLVLASTSLFRKELLQRLQIPFEIYAPQVDETRQPEESPTNLVLRLAEWKARAADEKYPQALIIGSDQVAVLGDTIFGKPHSHEQAVRQLMDISGQHLDFLTGLCLFNSRDQRVQVDMVHFSVQFRALTRSQIENYLQKEQPYHCAGSVKSEGLGIALLEKIVGHDPTALIGLPLIRLVEMLEKEGLSVV